MEWKESKEVMLAISAPHRIKSLMEKGANREKGSTERGKKKENIDEKM